MTKFTSTTCRARNLDPVFSEIPARSSVIEISLGALYGIQIGSAVSTRTSANARNQGNGRLANQAAHRGGTVHLRMDVLASHQ